MTTWVGIDPGARWTGVVVRQRDALLWHHVVDRSKVSDYLADVESAVVRAMHAGAEADSDVWYAVEDAVPPCGFKDGKRQFARPSDILALGQTLGWARHVVLTLTSPSRLVLVPPGGHGGSLLRLYPEALVSASERRHGLHRKAPASSAVSHAREAWDVAGAASRAARLARALQ